MREKGFTLLEIILVCALTTVIMGMLFASLVQSRIIFQATDISANLQADSRKALQRIALDLTQTARTRIAITKNSPFAGTDTLLLFLPQYDMAGRPVYVVETVSWQGQPVSIQLDPLGSGRLLRTENGIVTVLAQNLQSVVFNSHVEVASLYLNEVRVRLTFRDASLEGRNFSISAASTVKMRN